MKVALVHDVRLPVTTYGGTERVVWWLAKGLAERGIEVTLACRPGSRNPFGRLVHPDPTKPLEAQLPGIDVIHCFSPPLFVPRSPYVVTIEGNGKPGEAFALNTVFVSANHAARHGSRAYVHNGVDPDDLQFSEEKDPYLIFLAKASWRVKNVRGAIRLARRSSRPLRILGGERWWLPEWRGVRWEGMVGGERKAGLIARARGLLFPVLWHEPFGLAVVEALMSGTPVLATPFGSLPELVGPDVGAICRSEAEFGEALARLETFSPQACRQWAVERFHYRVMVERYLGLYARVLAGETLNAEPPRASGDCRNGCSLPVRTP